MKALTLAPDLERVEASEEQKTLGKSTCQTSVPAARTSRLLI